MPKPADQTGWPFCTTATEMAGTVLAVMKAETAFSICARFAGEREVSCAAAKMRPEAAISRAASNKANGADDLGSRKRAIWRNMSGPPERESNAEWARRGEVAGEEEGGRDRGLE